MQAKYVKMAVGSVKKNVSFIDCSRVFRAKILGIRRTPKTLEYPTGFLGGTDSFCDNWIPFVLKFLLIMLCPGKLMQKKKRKIVTEKILRRWQTQNWVIFVEKKQKKKKISKK